MVIKQHDEMSPLLTFSDTWDVLGPFQIGTREATWGADPLECLGGFRALERDVRAKFKSSLAPNGLVSWSSRPFDTSSISPTTVEGILAVEFPRVDWPFLLSVYGWAALQYQAWARGYLNIATDSPQSILLFTDHVLEFFVDGTHYFGGDFYAYRRAPLVLHLKPGIHKFDIRLVRDVRAMGGIGEPKVNVKLKVEIANGDLAIVEQKLLISDMVNETLASPFASVPVRNEGLGWVSIRKIESLTATYSVAMIEKAPLTLAPGQSRPLAFHLSSHGPPVHSISLKITYGTRTCRESLLSAVLFHKLRVRSIHSPHKFTFLHPSGTVSYAILRPPSRKAISEIRQSRLPILLNLHGAGLEADSDQVRHMLDPVPDLHAWILFPTGLTPWSSDDWHTWGFADVEAAAAAITDWIKSVGWKEPSVDVDRWLVSGHSNGGQGTWYALTHRPDKIVGAVPVSGYSSIQGYVPYQMWSEADPRITCMVHNALRSFRHELLVSNFSGIPILQQHGSADDNVPVFHSRRMSQLVSESNNDARQGYIELKDKNHWFDGVMSTQPLREFYQDILGGDSDLPQLPQSFSTVIANPADMGSRGGLIVDQLCDPNQLGKIEVAPSSTRDAWVLTTSNILRFHFSTTCGSKLAAHNIIIDKIPIRLPLGHEKRVYWLVRFEDGSWHMTDDRGWTLELRSGNQLGPLDSILRTSGRLVIRTWSAETFDMALQVSRNLFQYFAADSEIIHSSADVGRQQGSVISLAVGLDLLKSPSQAHSISITEDRGLVLRKGNGQTRAYELKDGLGAIYLRPLAGGRLELMIWGYDDWGLRLASRLVPMLTGVGQPEFIVVSNACAWKGAAGVLAMGSFENSWDVSEASFIS